MKGQFGNVTAKSFNGGIIFLIHAAVSKYSRLKR
jgi:hypothetical protein